MRVLSLSTPFELAFAKSLRARSKATRHRPLICWLKIDKSHPASRPKKKRRNTCQFPCSPLMLDKRQRHQSFCQNHTTIYHFPKSLKTDGISSQVQIITMMSSTVHCRGKVRRPEQKPPHRLLLQQHASCFVAERSWAWWTKIWKQTVEKPSCPASSVLTFRHADKNDEKLTSKNWMNSAVLLQNTIWHPLKAGWRLFVGGYGWRNA